MQRTIRHRPAAAPRKGPFFRTAWMKYSLHVGTNLSVAEWETMAANGRSADPADTVSFGLVGWWQMGEVGGPNAMVMNIFGLTLLGLSMIAFSC